MCMLTLISLFSSFNHNSNHKLRIRSSSTTISTTVSNEKFKRLKESNYKEVPVGDDIEDASLFNSAQLKHMQAHDDIRFNALSLIHFPDGRIKKVFFHVLLV